MNLRLPSIFSVLSVLALFTLLWGAPARAEIEAPVTPPSSMTSEQHIAAAQALFKEQKYSEAGDHLLAANELEPKAVLLFNAGQAYRKALRPVEARNAYQKLVTTYPDHPLVPESKGYVQTLDALISEVQAKQQVELSMMEQKAKSEKELAEERAQREAIQKEREAIQKELSTYKKPYYKKAWFWLLVSGGVIAAGLAITIPIGVNAQSKTNGGTQHLSFALTF